MHKRQLKLLDLFMKRMLDIIISFTGLIFLFPLMAIISLIILLDDKGPVFFCQRRIGKYGKPFMVYKFRTMKVLNSAKEGVFEPGKNSRVTGVGKLLRKTKIDELPQLFNVLIGNMSLVGPRPEVDKWVKAYPERWEKILKVKPGITDNASIIYRDEEKLLSDSDNPELTYMDTILPRKLDLYEEYVDNHTIIGDLRLIGKTIIAVFNFK